MFFLADGLPWSRTRLGGAKGNHMTSFTCAKCGGTEYGRNEMRAEAVKQDGNNFI